MKYFKPLLLLLIVIIILFIGFNKSFDTPIMAGSINTLLHNMNARNIIINDNDKLLVVETTANTVSDLLMENKISVNEEDIVVPNLKQSLQGVTAISIMRVTKHTYNEEVNIPYLEKRIPDDTLFRGQKQEVVSGETGITVREVEVTNLNNKPLREIVLNTRVIKEPINRVLKYGTKDTIIVNEKKYRVVKCLDVKATAYTKYYECTGKNPGDPYFGITASGLPVEIGHIAVDPKVIPLHSKVYVEGKDELGKKYTGIYTATDTGGAIKGNRIDVYMEDFKEMYTFGIRQMRIYVVEEIENITE